MWSLKKTIKGVAGNIADALNAEHSPSGGYIPGVSAGKSKLKGNDNSGSSSEGNSGGSETGNITDSPLPLKTPTNEASANDPMTVLEAYGKDLAAQRQEQAMQNLWDMASENYVFGRGDKHKATTLPTPADTLSVLNNLMGKTAIAPEPDEETKRLYEVFGLEPPAVTKNPLDRIQQAWEDWQKNLGPVEFGVEVSPDGLRDSRQWQAWSDVANSWRGIDYETNDVPDTAQTLDDQLNGNNENLLDYWGGTDIRDADAVKQYQQYQENLRHNADAKVDDYLNVSWDYLLGLATSGKKLNVAEKAEAKAAIDILKSKYGSAFTYRDREALAMLLENKSNTGGAIAAGVYDSLPFGEAVMNRYNNYTQNGDYLQSQYNDAGLIDALQQTNSFDLALQANPYAYLGGNAAGALAQWIGVGEGASLDDWLNKDVGKVVENSNIFTKPYTKSRPPYGPTQVEDVWNAHVNPNTEAVTDPSGVEFYWDRSIPRKGQWDMGHIPGEKYTDVHIRYMRGEISLDDFLEWYRNPGNYRPELPSTNRSHIYE